MYIPTKKNFELVVLSYLTLYIKVNRSKNSIININVSKCIICKNGPFSTYNN